MSSLILPTDNAVVDYSILGQMVAAINSMQSQLEDVQSAQTVVSVDPKTGLTTSLTTTTQAGWVSVAGKTSTGVITPPGIGSIISVTASVYGSSSTAVAKYCWISQLNSTTFTFTMNAAGATGQKVFWIVVGTPA